MQINITDQVYSVIKAFMATGKYEDEAAALEAALDERIDPQTGWTTGALRDALQLGLDDVACNNVVPFAQVCRDVDRVLSLSDD